MAKQIPGAGRMPDPPRVQGVKVRATDVGYYDHKRQREGDVFMIDGEKHDADVPLLDDKGEPVKRNGKPVFRFRKGELKAFSPRWMEIVDPNTPEHTSSAPEALKRAQEEITGSKLPTGSLSVI